MAVRNLASSTLLGVNPRSVAYQLCGFRPVFSKSLYLISLFRQMGTVLTSISQGCLEGYKGHLM